MVGIGLARVGAGFRLRRTRRDGTAVDLSRVDSALRKTLEEFRHFRPVKLRTAEWVEVPTAIGFFQPAVIVPAWTLGELSAEELHSVLLRELAHLRRWDDWTNLAQEVVGALFFFIPAVWWIGSRLSLERETARRRPAPCRHVGPHMAFRAQSDEIILGIVALLTPELGMVDLQIGHGPARLAAPPIALKHSLAQLLIGQDFQTESRFFFEHGAHAAGVTSMRNCCF
jgi:hypothetical protein